MILRPVSEDALMLYLGDEISPEVSQRVHLAVGAIEQALGDDLVDLVPSYASVLIIYDPLQTDHLHVTRLVRNALQRMSANNAGTERDVVTLPVYYAPESGADLEMLAARAGLSSQALIAMHCAQEYRVYAIGFAPGFAYMGQVDERIAAPRLATPRAMVPAGSVAIAERQTAVYPSASPGGWNLIGRCPLPMFNAHSKPHMPVSVGDSVRFEAISRERYLDMGGDLS